MIKAAACETMSSEVLNDFVITPWNFISDVLVAIYALK